MMSDTVAEADAGRGTGMMCGCGCGCGQSAPLAQRNNRWRGHERGQPLRFVQGHNRRLHDPLANVGRRDSTACWRWLGAHDRKGYARVQCRGVHTNAHRVVYELLVGPIPDGLQLDHTCHNPGCVNPAHLEPVTLLENVRRQHERRRMLAVTELAS